MRIVGIDPGVSGAIAMLIDGTLSGVVDMPTVARTVGKSAKQEVNGAALAKLLRAFEPEFAYLERVNAMPAVVSGAGGKVAKRGMGAASAFNFGESFGRIRGVLEALEIPYELVTPQKWKKAAGLVGAQKDASRARAQMLYPTAKLERKKDVGRAEALLIARFGGL